MSASQPAVRLSTGSGGLEWPEVLALLAREARTPMGREEALAAIPLADPDAVRRALGETAQARAAPGQTGAPPPGGVAADARGRARAGLGGGGGRPGRAHPAAGGGGTAARLRPRDRPGRRRP